MVLVAQPVCQEPGDGAWAGFAAEVEGSDELDGGDILPGFRLPLASLFQGTADNGAPNPT